MKYTVCWINEYGPCFTSVPTRDRVGRLIMDGVRSMKWENVIFETCANDINQDGLPESGTAGEILRAWVEGDMLNLSMHWSEWDIHVSSKMGVEL